MKIFRLVHSITILIIFVLFFLNSNSANNVSHNLNLLFNSNLNSRDGKNFLYFFSGLSILISYFIAGENRIFKGIYILLISISILFIVFSLKQF